MVHSLLYDIDTKYIYDLTGYGIEDSSASMEIKSR